MRRDVIMEWFSTFQDSEYATFLYMQALRKTLNMPEYVLINCSDYGKVLNMPGQSFTGL